MTYLELIAGRTYPTQFHCIVIAETHAHEGPKTFISEERTVYCAIAMEWYLTGSGKTIAEALHNLELVLFGQAVIYHEYPSSQQLLMAAPESYQRVATRGDVYIEPSAAWVRLFGTDRRPIVYRGIIDMAESQFTTAERKKP